MITYLALLLSAGAFFGASSLPDGKTIVMEPTSAFHIKNFPATYVSANIDRSNLEHLSGIYFVSMLSRKWGTPLAVGLFLGMEISDSTIRSEGADLFDIAADAIGIYYSIRTKNWVIGKRGSEITLQYRF